MKIAFMANEELLVTLEFERGAVQALKHVLLKSVESAHPLELTEVKGRLPENLKFFVYDVADRKFAKARAEARRYEWVVLEPVLEQDEPDVLARAIKSAKKWHGDVTHFEARPPDEFNLFLEDPDTLDDLLCHALSLDLEEQVDEVVESFEKSRTASNKNGGSE